MAGNVEHGAQFAEVLLRALTLIEAVPGAARPPFGEEVGDALLSGHAWPSGAPPSDRQRHLLALPRGGPQRARPTREGATLHCLASELKRSLPVRSIEAVCTWLIEKSSAAAASHTVDLDRVVRLLRYRVEGDLLNRELVRLTKARPKIG